jgi:hypothetical protein
MRSPTFEATKSAAKANIDMDGTPSQPEDTRASNDKTPSQPEITKVDMSVMTATKFKEQLSSSCETPGCGEPAKLQCPTCIKLNIQGSFFCSQFCFKGNWDLHKALHKLHKLHKNKTCNTYAAHSLMASTEKGLACSSQQQLQQSHNSWRSLLE